VGGTKSVTVDIRLLAASNDDLEKLLRKKQLRKDLYYRLNVVRINLPTLRERREDIPLLVYTFIEEFSRVNRKKVTAINPRALQALQAYDWPGNVRELKNCMESMVVLSKNPVLGMEDLPPQISPAKSPSLRLPSDLSIKRMEKELIRGALIKSSGKKQKAAELLGISRRTLYRKMEEYGLK